MNYITIKFYLSTTIYLNYLQDKLSPAGDNRKGPVTVKNLLPHFIVPSRKKSGTCNPLHHIPSLRTPSYYWAPRKRRCSEIHCPNPRISGDPPQTIVPYPVRTPSEWRRTPDLLEHARGTVGRKMRPITEPSCVTSISTVLPVLDHRQQWPVPFPPNELFSGERQIRRPPTGVKWRRRGWNTWRLRLSCRLERGLYTLCDCGGVWERK